MKTLNLKLLLPLAVLLALSSPHSMANNKVSESDIASAVTNARHEMQIWTTYALSPYLRAGDLSVTALDGNITLVGKVQEAPHKELAEAIAAGVSGVKDVDNRITVDANLQQQKDSNPRGFGEIVDDATITAAIKSKLLWNKHTEGMETSVVTKEGQVELSGTVTSEQASQQAEKLASNTQGVRSVRNSLKITGSADEKSNPKDNEKSTLIADSWITTKVKSTLMYSSNVSGSDISVNTDKGIVTLSGKVSSGIEHALAVELAQNIRGVRSVTFDLLTH
ncbi:BON domain-containing protein [Lacimicrobium sp. SS2-24]|uniref:BON domain-containing protein n=1 Tax=Lacimicrobium sp. SS2-24 TaxID=2005569 RepID=UPI000B4B6FBC|nr:BON domain-containing protein [Lacimicrobium sp. SS2-24]